MLGQPYSPFVRGQNFVAWLGIAATALAGQDPGQRAEIETNSQPTTVVELVIGDWLPGEMGGERPAAVNPRDGKSLRRPFGIGFDQQSNMYIVELEGGRVHQLDGDGRLALLAGGDEAKYSGDRGPAKDARFNGMHNLAVSTAGDLFIADSWNHCVRKISAGARVVTTIAGDGEAGFRGDGGPVAQARFHDLMCVAFNQDQSELFVADLNNRRIRAIDMRAKPPRVRCVAGNGTTGVPVDGQLALDSPLLDPRATAVDSQGQVYVLERGGHALRVVRGDGRIYTVAGTGQAGFRDGGAAQAMFNSPKHLCVDDQERVIIVDEGNAAIRVYDPRDNQVATILGSSQLASPISPAVTLSQPHGVCLHAGHLYIVDSGNDRVLRMAWPTQAGTDIRPLFNGVDLSGWKPINTAPSTWTIQDGLLVCSGKPTGELRTERMYQNFILELDWRHMVPKGNAGVFVWADDITAPGVPFHRGIEVQVLENDYGDSPSHTTHGDIFPIHGAKMVPLNGRGGDRAFPTESRSLPSPQWNHYRVTCRDGSISLEVNGMLVTQGRDCQPRKGYICLESEGGVVHYRNLRIKELPGEPVPDEFVAIADRGYRCLYNGIDLSGWSVKDQAAASWQVRDWVLSHVGELALASDSSLRTGESFGDFDFLLDVRLKDPASVLRLGLRGEAAVVEIDPRQAPFQNRLRVDRWSRVEGHVAGDMLTLSIDSEKIAEAIRLPNSAASPLSLAPRGPLDLANIYVK